jgi:3-methyladenine DNA glycosylase/8-oxoguanine DNA glycosylase
MAYLGARLVPGVESASDSTYRRAVSISGTPVELVIDLSRASSGGALSVSAGPSQVDQSALESLVRRLVDGDAPVGEIRDVLVGDAVLKPLVQRIPGVRIPGCADPFELAVRAILGQQVSVATARTLASRVASAFGQRTALQRCPVLFPTPGQLAKAPMERVGVSSRRGSAIRSLAQKVVSGDVTIEPEVPPGRSRQELLAIPGIGPWTEAYIRLRALGDRDSLPEGDRGLMQVFGVRRPSELRERADSWRPYRAYGAIYAWSTFLMP